MTTIVWFRNDLRLDDQPALRDAAERGPVLPVFLYDDRDEGAWPLGGASRWWLRDSLGRLAASLSERGSRLVLRTGPAESVLVELAREVGATRVATTRRYEPHAASVETEVSARLRATGVAFARYEGNLLAPPEALRTGAGRPFQVYTPFARAFRMQEQPARPLPTPERLIAPARWPPGIELDRLLPPPRPDWAGGLRSTWRPGEAGGRARLEHFVAAGLGDYAHARDLPGVDGVSMLSPFLHFGELSIRRAWHAAGDALRRGDDRFAQNAEKFRAELLWREFGHHVLVHWPHTDLAPLRSEFARFPWRSDPAGLRAWRRGETGYPIVDAGMRQLWSTGWMHNRVRMSAASFLVKHLLLPWQEGARWFWDTLVDADLANNSLGWQWSGGCGADAAPYFRIFNPTLQGEKFDADGAYVRRWIPELAALPDAVLHQPWKASPAVLERAGVRLGVEYPRPIVDHAVARDRALAALSEVSGQRSAHEG